MNLTHFFHVFPENNEDLFLLKQQLLKDFSPHNNSFPENFLSDKCGVNEIVSYTKQSIELILTINQQSLMQLINRVDIDEKIIKKIFLQKDFIESLLWEIIKKECSKILWRKKYK